jgi:hypothetical protein
VRRTGNTEKNMAKVSVNLVKVIKSVHIELSSEEAVALVEVLGKVGGDPDTSYRRHTQSVYDELRRAGIRCRTEPAYDSKHITGAGCDFVD